MKKEFQPAIDKHLKELVDFLGVYNGVLSAAIGDESTKLTETTNFNSSVDALKKQLAPLLKTQEIIKGDIEALLKGDIEGINPAA